MDILISNHHLTTYTGSEIFIYTISRFLKLKGHNVVVYSKFINKMMPLFEMDKIKIIHSLSSIRNKKFDLAIVSHNINVYEVRYYFQKLPIIYLAQGTKPALEQPPLLNLNISLFLAISTDVAKNLYEKGVPKNKIKIFRNIVDENLFKPTKKINSVPKNALIISNHYDENKEKIIRSTLENLKIKYRFIGQGHQVIRPDYLPKEINEADIVISLGRGVINAMLCERIPIVFDYFGADGMVTSDNFETLMKKNFSGRVYQYQYTTKDLINEINKYKASDGERLRKLAIKYYGAHSNIDKLVDLCEIYKKDIIKPLTKLQKYQLVLFINQIKETQRYTELSIKDQYNLTNIKLLKKIKESRFYRIWRIYCTIKDKFIKNND